MSVRTSLRVGFDLPFSTQVTTRHASEPLRIEVLCTRILTEDDLRRLEAHVQVFVAAAMYGMGAGALTPPRFSKTLDVAQVLKVKDRWPTAEAASYEAAGFVIDPSYIPVLLHKLYCLGQYFVPIRHVVVHAPALELGQQTLPVVKAAESDLPEVFPHIPFHYEADLTTYSQSLNLLATFEEPPDAAALDALKKACKTWAAQCLQGGFISPICHAENYFLVPDEDFRIVAGEFEWGLDKVQIDSRAFHSLANLFIAFSTRFARVKELSIV